MKLIPVILLLALAGCAQQPPQVQTRLVEVASSKPYRFIRWSIDDTAETKAAIRRHNRAHQAVIDAEKAK
jgi:hypothetical protein